MRLIFCLLPLILVLAASQALAEEKIPYAEFVDWCVKRGIQGIAPPDQKAALVDASDESTYADLGFEEAEVVNLKANGARGVFATASGETGDVVITIPFNATLMLTDDDPPLPFPGAEASPRLVVLFLREWFKQEKSDFWPFLRIVPRNLTVPWVIMHPESFKEMQYQPAITYAKQYVKDTTTWWKRSDPALTGKATLKDFLWANGILNTRLFWLPVRAAEDSEVTEERALYLPYGDMFNHRQPPGQHVDWEEKIWHDRVELIAVAPFKKGEEIFDYYGNRTNTEYYIEMGFVPSTNDHDNVILFENHEELIKWYAQAYKLCGSTTGDAASCEEDLVAHVAEHIRTAEMDADVDKGDETVLIYRDGSLDPLADEALEGLRNSRPERFKAAAEMSAGIETVLEVHTDTHNLLAVERMLTTKLAEFPTTIVEDMDLLAHDDQCATQEEATSPVDCTSALRTVPGLRGAVEFRLAMKRTISDLSALIGERIHEYRDYLSKQRDEKLVTSLHQQLAELEEDDEEGDKESEREEL